MAKKGDAPDVIKKPAKSDVAGNDFLSSQCDTCRFHLESECYRLVAGPRKIEELTECPNDNWKVEEYGGSSYKSKFPYARELCAGCRYDTDNHSLGLDECQGNVVRPKSEDDGVCLYRVVDTWDRPKLDLNFGDGPEPRISADLVPILLRAVNEGNISYFGYNSLYYRELDGCSRGLNRRTKNFHLSKGGRYGDCAPESPIMFRQYFLDEKNFAVTTCEMPVNTAVFHSNYSDPRIELSYHIEGQDNSPTAWIFVGEIAVKVKGKKAKAAAEEDEEEEEYEDEECCIEETIPKQQKTLEGWC
jgi:hypothetical protein